MSGPPMRQFDSSEVFEQRSPEIKGKPLSCPDISVPMWPPYLLKSALFEEVSPFIMYCFYERESNEEPEGRTMFG